MVSNYIKVGDRVEITFRKDESVKKGYMSLVESIISETELDLDVPVSYGKLVVLKPDDSYQLMFFTDNGTYVYNAAIERYFKADGFNLMRVRVTSRGEKRQRREFYRYECQVPIKFAIVPDNKEAAEKKLYLGEAVDISGGGLRFMSNAVMYEGNSIKCAFELGGDTIAVNAKVLYKEETLLGEYKYQYRVQFVRIPLSDQEKIVQFVFMQQRSELGRVF